MDDIDYNNFVEKLNKKIKCPILKKILFRKEEFNVDMIIGVEPILRVLTFSFLTVFIKWNDDNRKRKYDFYSTTNTKFIFERFNNTYKKKKIDVHAIFTVLSKMQKDLVTFGDKSYFFGIITSDHTSIPIPDLRLLIDNWFDNFEKPENNESIFEKFVRLCDTFPFLFNMEISLKKEKNADYDSLDIRWQSKGDLINSSLIFIFHHEYGYSYLSTCKKIDNDSSELTYFTLNRAKSYKKVISNDLLKNITN